MANQFIVPQFIDVEDKILGPISVRQFIIVIVGVIGIFASYQLFARLAGLFPLFLGMSFLILIGIILFAFLRVNGRPFHLFVLNVIQSIKNPRMRIWNNQAVTERLQYRQEPPPPPAPPVKQPLSQTKLARLSLLVDTGGAFHDDDTPYWGQTIDESSPSTQRRSS